MIYLRPGLSDTPENRDFAGGTARQIELDMKSGHFDPTLNRYRSQVNAPLKKSITAVGLFDKYFEFRKADLALGTQKKYQALRNQLFAQLKNKPATLKLDDVLKVKNWLSESFASVTAKDKICFSFPGTSRGIPVSPKLFQAAMEARIRKFGN